MSATAVESREAVEGRKAVAATRRTATGGHSEPSVHEPRGLPGRASPGTALRVAFVGGAVWLDGLAPSAHLHGHRWAAFGLGEGEETERARARLGAFNPHVVVVFDPPALPAELLGSIPGVRLGVLVDGLPRADEAECVASLDRLVAFDPALTGAQVGEGEVWRAIPPPVNDALYGDLRRPHGAPRAMSMGRSTPHREAMLAPVKHHHDLLHVVHGVSGALLGELVAEYDTGIYVGREWDGGFGWQVAMHLAAGHLLMADPLRPTHGLERGIDYLEIRSPEELVFVLDRARRFPEMHHGVRVRGRLKAEHFRASRLFGRIVHDLLADVAAFGRRAE